MVIISLGSSVYCQSSQKDRTPAAWSTICQRDAYDRPTIARIHGCGDYFSELLEGSPSQAVDAGETLTHELIHSAGFSETSLPLFRRGDGSPMIPREEGNFGDPADMIEFMCDLHSRMFTRNGSKVDLGVSTYVYPLQGIVESFSERGGAQPCPCIHSDFNASACGLGSGSQFHGGNPCVLKMVTPNVVKHAREFFDCPTLNGMEIENDNLASPCSAVNMHWESRILNNELMSSFSNEFDVSPVYVSPMTLAFFEDSGWFRRLLRRPQWYPATGATTKAATLPSNDVYPMIHLQRRLPLDFAIRLAGPCAAPIENVLEDAN